MTNAVNPCWIVAVMAGVIAWVFVIAGTFDNGWIGIGG